MKRAVVAIGKWKSWRLYYRHCHGHPTGLGVELVQLLKEGKNEKQIVELAKLAYTPGQFVKVAANTIFPGFQANLEWIYFVDFSTPTPRFDIFRTSYPYFEENFTFHVWGCYLQFLPTDWEQQLQQVQLAVNMMLEALEAFRKGVVK